MHVGMAVVFQNPKKARPDVEVYRDELALVALAEPLGFESVWGVEHHFTDYTMCPDVLQFENMRMPELFCGFPRVNGYGPTQYPVACAPQAWAAGVVFMLIASMLGLQPDAADNQITLSRPTLPGWLTWIEVRGLRVSKSRLGVRVSQGSDGAAVELLARDGDAELVVRR